MAVKQYAWFQVLHSRGGMFNGECYDVKDTTADQLYESRSLKSLPSSRQARDQQHRDWTMWRGDWFFSTTYRTGKRTSRAPRTPASASGHARRASAPSEGWSAQQILETYYTATLDKGDGSPPSDPPPDNNPPDQCTAWSSNSQPPPTIRVYRVSAGRVDEVDFKSYVMGVVYREFNSRYPALRQSGAVAAKQYAWYQVLHYRGGMFNGECYDVKDTSADQLYSATR